MAIRIPPTLGFPVTKREFSWEQEVIREWGSEYRKPDKAYKFSNGRQYDCTDLYNTGIYRRPG